MSDSEKLEIAAKALKDIVRYATINNKNLIRHMAQEGLRKIQDPSNKKKAIYTS
jgi:hypothetical protein